MASISIPDEVTPVTINKFLGLNSAEESETQLQLGEASEMLNLRITDNYKLETIEGYKNILKKEEEVDCLFQARIKDKDFFLYRKGETIYKLENEIEIKISNDFLIKKCSYICFDDKIYILDGNEYYQYDGEVFSIVEGYVPLVAIGTVPSGGGTDFEQINLLTPKRHQTFSPDGTSTEFFIREQNVVSIDKVLVNDEEVTTGITKDLEAGKVTFTTAPTQAVDNIDIYWTADNVITKRELITRNKYAVIYGSSNDIRIFIYGNEENKNVIYYSELGDGVARGDYYPANNFVAQGVKNYAVTGLIKHYDRLIVFKENETRFCDYEDMQVSDAQGNIVYLTALKNYQLNSTIGNKAFNQCYLLDNLPVCINDKGLYSFNQTNVKSETNVSYLSQRIQNELDKIDISKVVMFDYENKHELWITYENKVFIYNYNLDLFSKLELANEPTSYIVYNKELYFSCKEGIMKFEKDLLNFNDKPIIQRWESSYYNFERDYKRKNVNRMYLTLKPSRHTNINISFSTDRGESTQTFNTSQELLDFANLNFANFSFKVSASIKPVRQKIKAKKFVFFKLKLFNELKNTTFNVDSISLKYTVGGEAK